MGRRNTPLGVLQLNVRNERSLNRRGFHHVEEITSLTERQFIKEFGRTILKDAKEGLEFVGRSFNKEPDAAPNV